MLYPRIDNLDRFQRNSFTVSGSLDVEDQSEETKRLWNYGNSNCSRTKKIQAEAVKVSRKGNNSLKLQLIEEKKLNNCYYKHQFNED